MKKLLLFFVILTVVGVPSKGQFKSIDLTRDYNLLANNLEPMIPIPALENPLYFEWMDSLVSIHRELALFLQIAFPLDSAKLLIKANQISKEDADVIARIKLIKSFPQQQMESKGWKQRNKKKRYYYEKQRLFLIINIFEKAEQDSNLTLMASTLELMVFYYQNRQLLSTNKAYEEYQEFFSLMRKEYAFRLSVCLAKNNCKYDDVNRLFGLSLNAWPDINLAYGVLQKFYNQQWDYLFRAGDLHHLDDVTFNNASECFISLLYLYNIEGRTGVYELARGFSNLMTIPHNEWQKEETKKVLREYLNRKQKVFP